MFGCRGLTLNRPFRIALFVGLAWIFVFVVYLRPSSLSIPSIPPSWKEQVPFKWPIGSKTKTVVATTLPPKPGPTLGSRPPRPVKPIGEVNDRANAVKASLLHAWNGYVAHAWGRDELRPVSKSHATNLNDWGVTIVDTLDTLIIMGLRKEFYHAMEHVEKIEIRQNNGAHTPFFETVIRYLGGFLSAYAMVIDESPISAQIWPPQSPTFKQDQLDRQRFAKILLDKADKLGHALLPIFKTPSHFPAYGVNVETGDRTSHGGLLAEIASYQFEFKYLAYLTGKKIYFDVANDVQDTLEKLQKKRIADKVPVAGMLPSHYDIRTGQPTQDYVAVGALADSGYEYLLKGYLLSGRSETRLLDMWKRSAESALKELTWVSSTRDMTFITDATNGRPSMKLEHLSCFYPGLLTLGSELLNGTIKGSSKPELEKDMRDRYDWAAESIGETCYLVYANNYAHVGHETVFFTEKPNDNWWIEVDKWSAKGRPGGKPRGVHGKDTEKNIVKSGDKGYMAGVSDWLLRPETIESLFLLYRSSNDTAWQERCHKVYEGIETHSRTVVGYGSVPNPAADYILDPKASDYENQVRWHVSDSQPSYALAETFKYLFLCALDPQQTEQLLPRRRWIFSTEAHPFPVFEWTSEQIRDWNIR